MRLFPTADVRGALPGRSVSAGRPLTLCRCLAVLAIALAWGSDAGGQSQVPQTRLVPIGPAAGPAMGPASGPAFTPSPPLLGGAPLLGNAPVLGNSSLLGNAPVANGPAFDPYQTPIRSGPGLTPAAPGGGLFGGLFSQPASSGGYPGGPVLNSPAFATPPGTFDNPSVYGPPVNLGGGIGSGFNGGLPPVQPTLPSYPDSIYPQSTPSTLFPGGIFGGGGLGGGLGNTGGSPNPAFSAFRFLHGPRLRHTWIAAGDDADDLEVNTTDASVIFAFPNFLYGTQPIYVIPSFSLHLFDGPNSSTGADLPGQTYSAFLDFGYHSDPNRMLGTELGVRVGVFSDFDHFQSDALRVLGKGLVNFRLTPTSTVKLGVYYLDRLDWKVLPAGGILYQPDAMTRFDIFFPQPKFAKYWRTLGTQDVWWYIAGDYGGGSWAIEREDGSEDQFDLNELQATLGIEWGQSNLIRTGRRTAFAEIGYVFDRELVYRSGDPEELGVDDAFMIRLGFGY